MEGEERGLSAAGADDNSDLISPRPNKNQIQNAQSASPRFSPHGGTRASHFMHVTTRHERNALARTLIARTIKNQNLSFEL